MKGLEALKYFQELVEDYAGVYYCEIIEKELKVLEIIKENLKYGYVFIGYNKDNKPLFQFAGTKLYEEIKKNTTF